VTFLPVNYEQSWTLANTVRRVGIGLHTGERSEVHLLASDLPGFHVSWIGKRFDPVTLNPYQVRDSQLCTLLEIGKNRLSTVEHLLAALAGCGLTHVHIKVSGEEIPLLDGSALQWVEAIKEVGVVSAKTPRVPAPIIEKPLILNRGSSVITATPADKFKIIGIIEFPYEAIGRQIFSIELTPESFVKELAPARTFGFRDQVEKLINAGLIKGGALENALVCDGANWINPPLRFDNEPVRHKLLDLIGDLALVGFPKAQVMVYKGSHALHSELALAIHKQFHKDLTF
tara:strand:- start:643 stop:1503 length:861 start_codon:yes stop_codon:yes gene_type:complete